MGEQSGKLVGIVVRSQRPHGDCGRLKLGRYMKWTFIPDQCGQ